MDVKRRRRVMMRASEIFLNDSGWYGACACGCGEAVGVRHSGAALKQYANQAHQGWHNWGKKLDMTNSTRNADGIDYAQFQKALHAIAVRRQLNTEQMATICGMSRKHFSFLYYSTAPRKKVSRALAAHMLTRLAGKRTPPTLYEIRVAQEMLDQEKRSAWIHHCNARMHGVK